MPTTKAQKVTNKEEIFQTLLAHREQLVALGAARVGLFGSFARGEQHPQSDIDLFVEFETNQENFKNFMGLCFFLEKLFNPYKVEVVTRNGLSPYIGPKILKEVQYVAIAA